MGGSDENNPGLGAIRSTNLHGGMKVNVVGNGKTAMGTNAQTRRALSDINRNIVRPPPRPPNPLAVNKRGVSVSELNGCEKKQCVPLPVPVHRPITRKFAAQLLGKDHHVMPGRQEPPQKASCKDTNRTVIELDDIDEENDFVQQTEMIRSRTDQMIVEEIEIEMADIDEESITNIDSPDKNNPLAVVDYIDDLYAHYKKSEGSFCPSPSYMDLQSDINDRMRSILVDWLIEVHYKFELMEETLYLTVNLIDRFLSMERVARKKLQLVGITAMLVACKYEEVTVPVVEDMILISDKAYTRKEVLEMEKSMVNKLQFNLSTPTPYVFLRRFLKAAISDKKLEFLASYIIELSLVEYEMLKFQPSLLAAAAVFTAQCSIVGSKRWSNTSKWYSTYSEDQLLECAKLMVNLHKKAPNSRLTGVYRKYSLSKYGCAVRSEPALFLLDDDQ